VTRKKQKACSADLVGMEMEEMHGEESPRYSKLNSDEIPPSWTIHLPVFSLPNEQTTEVTKQR
jgi:hypothetical protein